MTMHLSADFIECASCGGEVTWEEKTHSNRCLDCGQTIPCIGHVHYPGRGNLAPELALTVEEFGKRWNRVYQKMGPLRENFLHSIAPVERTFFRDKVILDAGGGFGRLTKLMLDHGARHVVLLDLSSAVEAASHYLEEYRDRVTIVRGDLLHPPLQKEQFDLVMCHGVLHHTGQPQQALHALRAMLKPGTGSLILWVYAHEGNALMRMLVNTVRRFSMRIGDWGRWRLADLVDALLWLLTHLVYRPLSFLPGVGRRLWYGEYFLDFLFDTNKNNRMDRLQVYHDFLTTEIVEYYSKAQLASWLKNEGFRKMICNFHRQQSWGIFASLDPHTTCTPDEAQAMTDPALSILHL
ncbi:MAG: class I SAM-dependent methyltransferase [Magnetococcales bacterium]|nr:class I SAM-dependent methyltransferase [Magnetococcales bacterium]